MNAPTLRDLRRPPWLTAGAVVVLATGLVPVGDSPARGTSQAIVRRGSVTATAGAAGTVRSADTRELVFGTSGTVEKVEVEPGETVRTGQVLARLDDTAAKEQVGVAEAALDAAQDTYDKAAQGQCATGGGSGDGSGGTAGGSVGTNGAAAASVRPVSRTRRPRPGRTPTPAPTSTSPTPTPRPTSPRPTPTTSRPPTHSPTPTGRPTPTTRPRPGGKAKAGPRPGGRAAGCPQGAVEQAKAKVTQAEVKVRQARRTLSATTLKAPMAGTVLSVAGGVGDQVGPTAAGGFITLGDLDDLQVRAMFSLGDVRHLRIGQRATVGFAVAPGRRYSGAVTRIDPAATVDGRLARFGVMLSLDGRPAGLRTGMSATVEVVTARADGALYVPAGAVHARPDGTATVLVRSRGRTVARTVRLGVRGDRYVAIGEGLSDGDRVIVPSGTGPDGFPDGAFPGR